MLLYTLAGFAVGALIAATGVGGGSLMTPILIVFFGINPATAVGTDLLYATVTKALGTVMHGARGAVDWRVVAWLAAGSLPASGVTLLALRHLRLDNGVQTVITTLLGVTIVASALLTLFRGQRRSAVEGTRSLPEPPRSLARVATTMFAGAVVGMLVTLTSVGGGVIGTSALFLLYPHFKTVRVVGTDIAHAVLLTSIAGIGHLALGNPDLHVLLYLLLGSLPGIVFGTYAGIRLPDTALRPVVAALLFAAGLGLLI